MTLNLAKMNEENGGRIPYKKGLVKIVDQLGSESATSKPENENEPSQREREKKIAQIYDQLLLLEGYAAVRLVSRILWFVVIFQVLTSMMELLHIVNPSPLIFECRVWLPVVVSLGVGLYCIYLLSRGIPFKPVRQCLIIALALLGNAVLFYYHDYLKEFMRLIVGLQFVGK